MKMKKFMSLMLLVTSFLISSNANAERIVVRDAPIHLIASSKTEYQAHSIEVSIGIKNGLPHPYCNEKIYIPFSEKELFAVALAAKTLKRSVNIIYEDNATPMKVVNHDSLTCKVVAIWLSSEAGE
jgi:hypothetical protein